MNPNAQFERDLEQWLQAEAPASAPAGFHASVMDRARTLRQRPGWATSLPVRRLGRGRGLTLFAAAALLGGGALAAGSGIVRLPTVVPPVPEPSVVAVATASPDATSPSPSESSSPTPVPSATPAPINWTEASLNEDWPVPVRAEPAGGATVLQIRRRDLTPNAASDESHEWESDQYRDPTGDTGSDAYPWADIRWVEFCREAELSVGRVSDPPRAVDPRELWIAHGVVVDTDGDGVPDWRYGVDNVPPDPTDSEAYSEAWRSWRTDLHTGRTDSAVRDHLQLRPSGTVFYPGLCGMSFGAETAGSGARLVGEGLPKRFYAWASVIADGRVVATDYAPDVGWLDRSPKAKPLPKPGGTYVLQDPFPVHLAMTVPDGWTDHGGPELTRDGGDIGLGFEIFENPEDSCTDKIEPPLGPGLDDLVSYFKALPYIDISEMRYGTLGGYRAAYLEYGTDNRGCSPRPIPVNEYNDVWIVDVDGVRLVIAAAYESAPAETVRSEIRKIVESIQVVGVSPSYSPPASPSPTPRPTPRATPLPPAAGPVPPNARSWTVTVDNKSSEPAMLFVAGDGLELVGSATPNVAPAGSTVQVTFLFPAIEDGWIYVNPRPGEGGSLVDADQIGIPGKIVITADGQEVWASP